jgi:hypothetical protein
MCCGVMVHRSHTGAVSACVQSSEVVVNVSVMRRVNVNVVTVSVSVCVCAVKSWGG